MSVGHNGINVVRNGRVVWEPNPCGTPHHNYPETLCTEPAGHYRPDRDPHAGPLIVDGREIGGAAWDEPKETRMTEQTAAQATESAPWPQLEAHAFNAVQPALQEAGDWLRLSSRRAVARAVLDAVQPHLAGHYQSAVDAAVAAEQRAVQAEVKFHQYRDWLADQVAKAEAADQVGGVPPDLRISPHNGMAAGLRTALLGADRLIEAMDRAKEEA